MAEQLLSADPNAGRLLSADASAGQADAPVALPPRGWQASGTHESSDSPPSDLATMLGPLAHPQTLTDFARLLMVPVDAVRSAAARAVTMAAARPAIAATGDALKSAAGAVVRGGVNTAAAVGDVVDPDLIGVVSPRVGKAIDLAQKMRAKLPAAPIAAAPAEAAPAVDEFTAARAARQAAPAVASDQRALNEAALAARRSAYQASLQGADASVAAPAAAPPAGPIVAASGKMQLTAPEMTEFIRLTKRMPLDQALAAVKDARELAARLGGATGAEVAKAVAQRGSTGAW